MTSLFDCITNNNYDNCLNQLKAGADVNKIDPVTKWTPLHHASSHGFKNIVELLLSYGASIDAKDNRDNTPLHEATFWGHYNIAQILVSHNASIGAQDDYGRTPLHYVIMYYDRYKSNDARTCIKLFSQSKHDINLKDWSGLTPLNMASMQGNFKAIEVLLSHGASIDEPDRVGNTALHYASHRGDLESVKLLLNQGANFTIKNNKCETALDIANNEEIRTYIEEYQSVPDIKEPEFN